MFIPTPHILPRQALPTDTTQPETTTVHPSSTSVAGTIGGTGLVWWQLLCIGLGGAIAVLVGIWLFWRHKRKSKIDLARVKEAEKAEAEAIRAEIAKQKEEAEERKKAKVRDRDDKGKGGRGRGRWSGSDWSSESYDSVSDGGTIRPRRHRKLDAGRRGGRRRRWSDSESGWSDSEDSDYGYVPRNRRRRGRRRGGTGGRYSDGDSDDEIKDYYDRQGGVGGGGKRDRRGGGARRRYDSDTPTPTPSPPSPLPNGDNRKRNTFRDSVFSSYASMKRAAVRLKHVEQKVKLKKELEAEDVAERSREKTIKVANADLQRQKNEERRMKDERRLKEALRARQREELDVQQRKKMRIVEMQMEEANREVEGARIRAERLRKKFDRGEDESSGGSGEST